MTHQKNCLSEEDVAALADGSVSAEERETLELHLEECAACRREVLEVLALVEPGEGDPPVPSGLADWILETIPGGTGPSGGGTGLDFLRKGGRIMRANVAYLVALAAIVVVGIGVWVVRDFGGNGTTDEDGKNIAEKQATQSRPGSGLAPGQEAEEPVRPPRVVAVGEPAKTPDLGGERYLAQLFSDKPLYRPGEKVYARAVILGAFSRRPLEKPTLANFEVRSPKGVVVAREAAAAVDSVAAYGWAIPTDGAGGTYTLTAKFPAGYPDAELDFDVRGYRVPRLRTDLQFLRRAYGPGEEVTATLTATRAEGGIPKGARVTAVALVDAEEVARKEVALDGRGSCLVTFSLPDEISVGDGTLSMTVEDGGVRETAAKSIPIVVNRLQLAFYPEGGDLVAGLPGSVYFEARTPKDDPADVSGRILDADGNEVARFESLHEGRGRCAFTPEGGARYHAVIDTPRGVTETFPLPEPAAEGFSLATLEPAVAAGSPVNVRVASPVEAGATVALFQREKELDREVVGLAAAKPVEVRLEPEGPASGVLRVTVFDAAGKPRAERLVFREPEHDLRIDLEVEPARTVPASEVTVRVRTLDSDGNPVSAVIGLSAVDDAVLETVDRRERAPRLPVAALLGADVRELKDAAVYLAGDPEAPSRVDLLLGTQGWRRFAFVDPEGFAKERGMAARRALAMRVPAPPGAAGLGFDADLDDLILAAVPEARPVQEEGEAALPDFPAPDLALDELNQAGLDDMDFEKVAGGFQPQEKLPALELQLAAPGKPLRPGFEYLGGEIPVQPAWARVFAHRVDAARPKGVRTDFRETVYWNAGLKTADDGTASFSFFVSDSVTSFRVRADGFTSQGALGEGDALIGVRRPFYLEPKFPLEVTAGDRIDLPVSLVNGTGEPLEGSFGCEVGAGLVAALETSTVGAVAGNSSARAYVPLTVEPHRGKVSVRIRGQAGTYRDDVTREIAVVPPGFPIEMHLAGVLEEEAVHTIDIPAEFEAGSLVSQAVVYPTPLASMAEALEALLREPSGCFEQTSSSNYPNLLTLLYMKTHSGVDPKVVRRASGLLDKGYKRLVSFECKQKGYEWFGGDPGHEALTAYGVMEFADMQKVYPVDTEMLERTTKWLLSRRDGKGGFARNPRALDSFGGAPKDITDAYIVWALSESGVTGEDALEAEIEALKTVGPASDDPYLLALAANALFNVGEREVAEAILGRLGSMQNDAGAIPGAKTSITRSGGESLAIETVSLAILGWLRSPKHAAHVEKAIRWLSERAKGGRFGATQSTILALKAIIAYDESRAQPRSDGKIILAVDGRKVAEVPYTADDQGPIRLPDFVNELDPGRHRVELLMDGEGAMPYSLEIRYHSRQPASATECRVGLETKLSRPQAVEGEPLDVAVEVKNRTVEGLPMAIAIIGLPGGLEARADQLKELVREGKVDAVETRGREVILYWRALEPQATKSLTVSCLAAVPGQYIGPASRAYLYYTDEHKVWVPGLKVQVTGD